MNTKTMRTARRLSLLAGLLLVAGPGCTEPAAEATAPPGKEHGDEAHGDEEHGDEAHGDEGHGDEDEIRLSEEAIARAGIRVETVSSGVVSGNVTAPAEVQFNPDRLAHVSPLVDGQIRKVLVSLGDRVEAGQPLAILRSVELGRARAEYHRARAMLDVAKANLDRQQRLRKEGIASERSYLDARFKVAEAKAQLEAARAQLAIFGVRGGSGPDFPLEAEISGIVVERHATRGESVGPRDTLFVVADLSNVWVLGRVYEQSVAAVEEGMHAILRLRAYPGRTWKGTVTYVASTLDEQSRTLPVRVEIDNPDGALRPGLFGTLQLHRAANDAEVPVVPEQAVQEIEGRTVVFVPGDEPGTFHAVPVAVGLRGGGLVEIAKGLSVGDRVVTDGAFVLKSHKMRSQLGEGHAH